MQTAQHQVLESARPRLAPEEARRLARARTLIRRRRIRRIRRSAVGLTVALFIAAWATIFVQLSSGHDPALTAATRSSKSSAITASSGPATDAAGSGAATVDRAAARVTPAGEGSDTASGAGQEPSSGGAATASQSASPAPVTTSQS